jgi:cytidine deaminase
MTDIDWDALRSAARAASERAYVPYSHYPVGVAALTDTGNIVTGANVENASYGLTLCAECALVSKLHTDALGKRLVAFACVDAQGSPLQPCGRCRQLLYEFGGEDLLLDGPDGTPMTMTEILPWAFGPQHLEDSK